MFTRTILPTTRRILTQQSRVLVPRLAIPTSTFTRSYHEKVIDHYENPRNVGSLNKESSDVGTGLVGAPACGDVMRLQIQVDEETGKIKDVKFKTFGCGSAIASSSYATELIRGKTLDEALDIKTINQREKQLLWVLLLLQLFQVQVLVPLLLLLLNVLGHFIFIVN